MTRNYDENLTVYVAAVNARQILQAEQLLEARRQTATRRMTEAAERWEREVRARRFWKRIALALAAVLLMEVGGVIALALMFKG